MDTMGYVGTVSADLLFNCFFRLMLLASGADPKKWTSEGRTAIDIAREYNQEMFFFREFCFGIFYMQFSDGWDFNKGGKNKKKLVLHGISGQTIAIFPAE